MLTECAFSVVASFKLDQAISEFFCESLFRMDDAGTY